MALKTVRQEADRVVALGMDHHQRLVLLGDRQHFEDLAVCELQVVIGHEDLERRESVVDQRRQFLAQHLRRRVGDDEMEGNVDMAVALRLLAVGLDAIAQAATLLLQAERHDERVAADGSRARSAVEVVGHDDARCAGLVEMDMAVDAARHHQQPLGVDDLVGVSEAVGERHDAPIPDADIAGERVGSGHDGAVCDDRVVGHGRLLGFRRGRGVKLPCRTMQRKRGS